MATVKVIEPNALVPEHLRVAAYCRVSTDSEEQLNSYEAQKTYYTQKIQDNPDWEMRAFTQMRASPEPASKRERSSIR